MAWEIKRGRLGRLLRDATYTGVTPRFWGSLDRVAGPEAWVMHGLTNCGKGQPGQHAHVSHGASPARFRERPGRREGVMSQSLELAERALALAEGDAAEVGRQVRAVGLRPLRGAARCTSRH